MKKKVLIVASGPSMSETPFEDEEFDLFALNAAHRQYPADLATEWFQPHRPRTEHGHIDDEDHVKWLRTWGGCVVWMAQDYAEFPMSRRIPHEEWFREALELTGAPVPMKPYFTSTVDYMVCRAILRGYEEIHLYGTDMNSDVDSEYMNQKPGLSFWCGLAAGLGRKVVIPDSSALLKAGIVYGIEPPDPVTERLMAELQGQIEALTQEIAEYDGEIQKAQGRKNACQGAKAAHESTLALVRLRERGGRY